MSQVETASGQRVFTGKLHRVRQGNGKAFVKESPPPPEPVRQPARVAIMLAFAHKIQDAIDHGIVADQAEAARFLRITRARVTQILDLVLLSPDIQEQILFVETVDGVARITERTARKASQERSWADQKNHRMQDGFNL